MKLPWDQKYLKISFHVIVTILAIYCIGMVIARMNLVYDTIGNLLGTIIHVSGPLLTALVFAYLVNPAVAFFEKILSGGREGGEPRTRLKGTIAVYVFLFLLLFLTGRTIAGKLGGTDVDKIAESINQSIQGFGDMLVLLNVKLAEFGILENVDVMMKNVIDHAVQYMQSSIFGIANSFTKAGNWAMNAGIGLTVAFYLLMEKDKILYYCKDIIKVFLPQKWADSFLMVCSDINGIFSGYIGGQVLDAIIVAAMISITFSILGIPYPIVIGVISGFSNLIPYIGAIVAFVLSVTLGLFSGTPIKALYAAIAVLVLQQIDGMFIVPKVVGKSVELHPVLVILSLSIFGSLFGILGMVVAVPVTAAIKLFLYRFYQKKKAERNRA